MKKLLLHKGSSRNIRRIGIIPELIVYIFMYEGAFIRDLILKE